MKKVFTILSAMMLLVGINVYAQAMKVGVIDLPQILQHSPQVAAINKKLQSQFKPQQEKIITEQNKIRSEAQKLSPNNAKSLNEAEKKAIQEKVRADQKRLQEMVIEFQRTVSSAQAEAMKSFMGEIKAAVMKIAKEQNLSIVLLKPAVIYAAETVDITQQVQSQLPNK